MKLAAIAMLLAAAGAFAGVTITESPPSIELHSMPDNKMVPGPWPPNYEACKALGTDLVKASRLGDFACVTRNSFKVAITCADELPPHIPLIKVDGNYVEPEAAAFAVPGDATRWETLQWLYVHNPAWPAGYPVCWIRGWADPDTWRVNPIDPANVFMERIEPGMADIDLPNSVEPVIWRGDVPAP